MDVRGRVDDEELVGSTEAARRLDISTERIRQMAKARMLPRPVGRLGRQDVWRWSDLEAWAISTGRLDAEAGAERQPVRAWQPGIPRMKRTVEQLVQWSTPDDAVVHVRVWESIDSTAEPPVVLLGDLENARSVSNGIEEVVATVAERLLGDRFRDTQFYEYAPEGGYSSGPALHHVTFTFRRDGLVRRRSRLGHRDLALLQPQWRPVTRDEIERLTGETLELYTPGSYTIELVRAALEAGHERVTGVLDPEDATLCARAFLAWESLRESAPVLKDLENPDRASEVISTALANRAVSGRELSAKRLTWQDPDSPIFLREPDLPEAQRLRAKAGEAQQVLADHSSLWEALSAIRLYLSRHSDRDLLLVVPAVTGGYSRLECWEVGVEEDDQGLPYGLARPEADPAAETDLTPIELCRVVETTLGRYLYDNCTAFADWDVPAYRPTGPLSTTGPATQRYFESVQWETPDPDNLSFRRLQGFAGTRAFDSGSKETARFGRDGNGAGVLVSADSKTFYAEWPIGNGYGQVSLETRIWADPPRNPGPAPVFLFDDSGIRPLPSNPRRSYSAEYTWGYSGTGPRNLSEAITDAVTEALSQHPEVSPAENWQPHLNELVYGGRAPGWRIGDIIRAEPAP